jgi:hypothetical protein
MHNRHKSIDLILSIWLMTGNGSCEPLMHFRFLWKVTRFIEIVSDYSLLRKDSDPWNCHFEEELHHEQMITLLRTVSLCVPWSQQHIRVTYVFHLFVLTFVTLVFMCLLLYVGNILNIYFTVCVTLHNRNVFVSDLVKSSPICCNVYVICCQEASFVITGYNSQNL